MQLVIIAGGKGTRLKEISGGLPKPMVEVGGKPLLEHQVTLARKHGIRDILILTGFGAGHIETHFGDGSPWDLRIHCHREESPLGTAGALLNVFEKLADTFLVMYGDTLLNVDLQRMLAAHPPDAAATLFLHPNDHPRDSDLVEWNQAGQVIAIHPYPHPPDANLPNLVNAALYVFTKSSLSGLRVTNRPFDIAKHLLPILLRDGAILRGYRSREYIKDAGTPERLENVRRDWQSGRVQRSGFETPAPAVFLDRDGTLNVDHGWISRPEKIELLPAAAEAVRLINRSGRLAVVITNQPVIARGACTEMELRKIHDRFEWLLGLEHAYVDAIYHCPHHPEAGFPGERADLKIACQCRKPATGLFEQAARDLNIDLTKSCPSPSWMIGDSAADLQAAAKLGIPSVLVASSQQAFKLVPSGPQLQAKTVLEAVHRVLKESPVPA